MKLKPNSVTMTNWALLKLIYIEQSDKAFPEVIFGEGKTKEQIKQIIESLTQHDNVILVTRIDETKAKFVLNITPISSITQ